MLTVQDLAFDGNSAQATESPLARALKQAESSPVLIKYVALIVGMLVVVAFGVRPALKRVGSDAGRQGCGQGIARLGGARPLPAHQPAEIRSARTQEIFEQVTEHIKREPTQSSRLLQSWIHSD